MIQSPAISERLNEKLPDDLFSAADNRFRNSAR
jgi:hypothetical protein